MPTNLGHDHPPPGFQGRFAAELISARSTELAELAAAELVNSYPALAARYQPLPRQKWATSYLGRLADLAAALFAEKPEVFTAQVEWARAAFEARGVPVEDLRASLEVLRRVVVREVTPDDSELVEGCLAGALAAMSGQSHPPPMRLSADTPHGRVAASFLLKILEGDRMGAAAGVHEAVKGGLSVRSAYLEVLAPVQQELGRMWHLNEIGVAEEHFATSTTLMVMAQLLPLAERKPWDGRVVLAAAVDGNTHDLGVRVVADFFEMAGWRAIHLGASVPAEDLMSAVQDFGVHLVALSAALPTQVPVMEATIATLSARADGVRPKIVVGGPAFCDRTRELWRGIGADGFAADADDAVRIGEQLVPKPPARAGRA